MNWLRSNLGTIITLAVLLLTAGAAYGRMAQLCRQIELKADRTAITRELDQIHTTLRRMEDKIDGL